MIPYPQKGSIPLPLVFMPPPPSQHSSKLFIALPLCTYLHPTYLHILLLLGPPMLPYNLFFGYFATNCITFRKVTYFVGLYDFLSLLPMYDKPFSCVVHIYNCLCLTLLFFKNDTKTQYYTPRTV